MEKFQRMVSDRLWVCALPEIEHFPCSLYAVVSLQQVVNEVNKMKRLFLFSDSSSTGLKATVTGDQFQRDIRLWLSPPDPSMNHDHVCKARHKGTAKWFLESRVLADWKLTGSLLWIHGKRMFL
jgi:hypothetical protein